MTSSTNTDVIAGEDLTDHAKKKLHTDDIAGAGRPDPEQIIAAKRSDGDETVRLAPLFTADVDRDFRNRWRDIQTGFVDAALSRRAGRSTGGAVDAGVGAKLFDGAGQPRETVGSVGESFH